MQCDLLMTKSRDPRTITLVKGNIGHIFDGSLPHCADSLKLGLKKAFDLKKKERQPPGVGIRCTNGGCGWYNNPPSYPSIVGNVYCQCCGYRYYFMCTGCGNARTVNCASCQHCGKRFI